MCKIMNNKWHKRVNDVINMQNLYNGIYIPKEYHDIVLKHIILNASNNINSFNPSLFLAIQGEKGEGKTFMIEKLCQFYGIKYIQVSGAELCGGLEGDAVGALMRIYEKACVDSSLYGNLSCIVIDDFHKSIAAYDPDKTSRTTNADNLVGRLMNLADKPYINDVRIPIILTANDYTTVYSALTRLSRMEFFTWRPNLEDKTSIIYFMFKKFYPEVSFDKVEQLVKKYPNQYIAFYKALIQQIFWGDCQGVIAAYQNNYKSINLNNITNLVTSNLNVSTNLSLDFLINEAELLLKRKPEKFD